MNSKEVYRAFLLMSVLLFILSTAIIPKPMNAVGVVVSVILFTIGAVLRSIEKSKEL